MTKFDIIIIGGGPGGYVAAIRAAQLGMKTALVEKEHLGGICLNWGCIPTKALLRSSEINHLLNHLEPHGFKAASVSFDFEKIIARSRKVAEKLSGGIKQLLKKNKVTVFDGHAQIKAVRETEVEISVNQKDVIIGGKIVLATGARARQIVGMESDGDLIWTYKEAMTPKSLPKSVLVVGSGAIGVEFASFYNNMGVKVHLVEMAEQILLTEDAEIAEFAEKSFSKQGIQILKKVNVKKMTKNKNSVTVLIEKLGKEEKIEVEKVIMAVGIVGNVENLGLEKTKIKIEKSHIVTNEFSQTDEKLIYAIGDVAGTPWLAHKASHEAIIAVEKINGQNVKPLKKGNIPGCIYSTPQIASVGLTEKQAKEAGFETKIGRFPFYGNGKAIAIGEEEGLMKTIFDVKTGELLGAHLIGAEVTEMIQGFVIAKTMEGTELDLMHTIFPHPTLSEMMHESVLNAYGKAIHI